MQDDREGVMALHRNADGRLGVSYATGGLVPPSKELFGERTSDHAIPKSIFNTINQVKKESSL